jgi:hypothetical protein
MFEVGYCCASSELSASAAGWTELRQQRPWLGQLSPRHPDFLHHGDAQVARVHCALRHFPELRRNRLRRTSRYPRLRVWLVARFRARRRSPTSKRAPFGDFRKRHGHENAAARIRDIETMLTGIAPMPDRFDPHFRCCVECLEIRGFDIGEFDPFLVAINTVRGVEIEEK